MAVDLSTGVVDHALPEQASHQANDLPLRTIRRFVARDDITEKIIISVATRVLHHVEQARRHLEELRHRRDIKHLRMNNHAERCAPHTKRTA